MSEYVDVASLNIQEDTIKLSTFPEFTAYQLKPCSYCVDVKLTAPPFSQDDEARAPIDLVAVIDRSGSMVGVKLELVKKVLHFVVSHLKNFDRLGIVIYDNCVQEIAPLTKVTQTSRIQLDGSIDKIYGDRHTNLSGGLIKGMTTMKERNGEMADVASVFLFTDGRANVGITNTDTLVTAMSNLYGEAKSYSVNTFGFGSNHNVEMLKRISHTGNGLYYFIQNTEQIPEVFTNCLGGLLSTVAQNISVCVETCNGAFVREILSKDKPEFSDGYTKGRVFMGDLQSEEEHDILVELILPATDETSSDATSLNVYAKITLSYFNVIKKNIDIVTTEVSVPRCSHVGKQTVSSKVDEQRNRIRVIESLAKAAEMAERGKLEEARKIISHNQKTITTSSSRFNPKVSSLSSDLSSAMEGLSDANAYQKYGKSAFATLEDCHSCQRSPGLLSPSYITPKRKESYKAYHEYANAIAEDGIDSISQLSPKPPVTRMYQILPTVRDSDEGVPVLPQRPFSRHRHNPPEEKSKTADEASEGPPYFTELQEHVNTIE